MRRQTDSVSRIDATYAAEQAAYYVAFSVLGGFAAVFLTYRGLSDSMIGVATSLGALVAVLLQIGVSGYCDRHERLPVKWVVCLTYAVAVLCGVLMDQLALPALALVLVYSVANGLHKSEEGLLSAQMMQFNNAGIHAHYGWTRGMGSVGYALGSLGLGFVVEKYAPDVLMPLFIAAGLGLVLFAALMPVAPRAADSPRAAAHAPTSYAQMLKGNKTLVLFLIAVTLNTAGKLSCYTFLIRIIERLGGGAWELGVSMLIQSGVEIPMMLLSTLILKRFKSKHLIACSFVCDTLKVLMILTARSIGVLYAAMAFSIFCFGLFGFSSVPFANDIVPDGEKVRAQGLMTLCASLGTILCNLYAGVVVNALGVQAMLAIGMALCAGGAVAMMFCCRAHTRQFSQTTVTRVEARIACDASAR